MGWLIAALASSLALLGCPETGDDDAGDDDAADDDAADDDVGDDDAGDDDAGDDDVGEGNGTMDLVADDSCGPIRSALVIDEGYDKHGVVFYGSILASTEPWTCDAYWQARQDMMTADEDYSVAYEAASKKGDGAAACAATLAYYQALAASWDPLSPPGSCTLNLYPTGIAPGVYDIDSMASLRYYAWVEIVHFSYNQAIVDYLDSCNGITSWSSWDAVNYAIYSQGDGAWDWWDVTAGQMTLGEASDITAVSTGNVVENFDTAAQGTLDFDLEAVWCAVPSR